jgi:hypothetical protein
MDSNSNPTQNDKLLHSNAFARIANGGRLGSVSAESFRNRRQIDDNRRIIHQYRNSAIGRSFNVLPPNPCSGRSETNDISRVNSLQAHNNLGCIPRGYTEPTPRPYNPYR